MKEVTDCKGSGGGEWVSGIGMTRQGGGRAITHKKT